nr:DNA topoisomerase [Clostridium pasteurianum]
MSKILLAEKPSVARNIAEALECKNKKNGYIEGKDYIVTWAFGHLLTLYDCKDYDSKLALWSFDNFPYIPKEFKYKIKNDSKNRNSVDVGAKKQLNVIGDLINKNEVTEIIVATDYDREGELIAFLIINYLKINKPVYRILINEWTPKEIKKGLNNLKKASEMKSLQDAGLSRQLADWVIGINFTSIATMKYTRGKGNLLNIGRVLMPTLKMIYDREMQIKNFKVEEFFELIGNFKNEKGMYKGKFFYGKKDKFPNKKDVQRLKDEIQGKDGIIIEKIVQVKKKIHLAYLI